MYKCPWCERQTFSFWQKQKLGPNSSVSCTGCKKRVSVHWGRAHLAALPMFLLAIAGMWFVGDASGSKIFALGGATGGVILGMMVLMPLYHRFVPLVKPERKG